MIPREEKIKLIKNENHTLYLAFLVLVALSDYYYYYYYHHHHHHYHRHQIFQL